MAAILDDSDEEMLMACQALEKSGITGGQDASCQPVHTVNPTAKTGDAGDGTRRWKELPAQGADPAIAQHLTTTSAESGGGSPQWSSGDPLLPEAQGRRGGQQKRKRPAQKSGDRAAGDGEPPAAQPDSSEASDDGGCDSAPPAAAFFALKDDRARRNVIGNRLRRRSWYHKWQQEVNKRHKKAREWPARWSALPAKAKQEFVTWWLQQPDCGLSEQVADWTRRVFLQSEEPDQATAAKRFRVSSAPQALLTYQGAWGEISCLGIVTGAGVGELPVFLRKEAEVQQLWEKIQRDAERLAEAQSCEMWGLSLEICPQTLAETGKVRLHGHLALCRRGGKLQAAPASLQLLGTKPHCNHYTASLARKGRAASYATMYYCSVNKVGQVFSKASCQPHKDYPVNAEWAWTLLAADKITSVTAREEFIKGKKNLTRHLANLDAYETELAARTMAAEIAAKNVKIEATKKKMVKLPAVTAWMEQIRAVSDRKKFLVLNGPSRLGKTQFAVGLAGAKRTLEVNCAGASHPPLRNFDPKVHNCVIFDEASPRMVLQYRRLFQAPNCQVIIGQSPTNQSSYPVYLNDTALVVCSNTWHLELPALAEADRCWLQANMVYVEVKERLWVDEE